MRIRHCPCCGSEKARFNITKASDKDYGYVYCENCKLTQGETSCREKTEAIELWNTRYIDDSIVKEIGKVYREAKRLLTEE